MDRERLEYALKIVASEPGSALDTAFSSMVNLIIENHEKTVNSVIYLVQPNIAKSKTKKLSSATCGITIYHYLDMFHFQ